MTDTDASRRQRRTRTDESACESVSETDHSLTPQYLPLLDGEPVGQPLDLDSTLPTTPHEFERWLDEQARAAGLTDDELPAPESETDR